MILTNITLMKLLLSISELNVFIKDELQYNELQYNQAWVWWTG